MYIRTQKRQNKNGSITEYLQLAHNEWDKQVRRSTVKILINFGRKEEVDVEGLERLVASIQRYIGSLPDNESKKIYAMDVQQLSSKAYAGAQDKY